MISVPARPKPLRCLPRLLGLLVLGLCVPVVAGGQAATAEEFQPRLDENWGDRVSVFSGDLLLPANSVQHGSVICIGGHVLVEGKITGDLVVILGSAEIRGGAVERQVTGVFSDFRFTDARVGQDLVSVAGSLELERSQVSGGLVNVLSGIDADALTGFGHEVVDISFGNWFPSIWKFLFWVRLIGKLLVFALLIALLATMPERIRRVGQEAPVRYLPAFFVGILGYLGLLILLPLLAVTVIGVPLALLGFWTLKWLGIAAIFAALGRGIGRAAGRELSLHGSVVLCFAIYLVLIQGTMLFGLPGFLLSTFAGFLFFLLVEVPAVGLVLLTRAGAPRRPAFSSPVPTATPAAGVPAAAPPSGAG